MSEVKSSWADEIDAEEQVHSAQLSGMNEAAAAAAEMADDDSAPPPGFEGVQLRPVQDAGAEELAAGISAVHVTESEPADEPDRHQQGGLQEGESEPTALAAGESVYTSAATFEELPLSPELLQGLYTEMKFERPSRIQALTLPMVLTPPYRSLIAQAHNGSGKTTCFVLSMLSRVEPSLRQPQALCVCPTRELVVQNLAVLERMGKYTSMTATSTASGDSKFSRRERVVDQLVVGTHGSLKAWMSKRLLPLKYMKILVFDEADEMLKQEGFASDSVRMIQSVRREAQDLQILLFSATFNERVKTFALKVVGPEANQVFVPKENLSLDVIKQYRVNCPSNDDKTNVLKDMIFPQAEKLGQTIIFVRTRRTARDLHHALETDGHRCTSIHGDLDHEARDRVVSEFRSGTTKILIATDVLSRGFDVTQVTLVVNYDVPVERDGRLPAFETYLHRIGRSGRFGRKGAAFNLVTGAQEASQVDQIATYFHKDIPEVPYNDEDAFLDVLQKAGLTSTD